MPWWDGLSPETIRMLRECHPTLSLEQVALEAMQRPGYGEELVELGAKVETYDEYANPPPGLVQVPPSPGEFPRIRFPRRHAASCRDLVVAAMLGDHELSETAAPTSVLPLPPLPNPKQIASYTYATLQKAVKAVAGDETGGDVASGARLPPPDARRVRLMFGADLLRLNTAGKLAVDDRVARKGSRYVLRYLDESGTRWLDPDVELRRR
jgi:hypothetical protein